MGQSICLRRCIGADSFFRTRRAGKSTALSIIACLLVRSSGSVLFEGNTRRPPPGTIGIVPQKNVLFPELTCYQTLRVWRAIKGTDGRADDDIEQLLRDCDLGHKIHANASTLSGGQKRKLQLAIGLIGGSKSKLYINVFDRILTLSFQFFLWMNAHPGLTLFQGVRCGRL